MSHDLIRLEKGVFLWPQYPPYTIMLGYEDKTEQLDFETLADINLYLRVLGKLKDYIIKRRRLE